MTRRNMLTLLVSEEEKVLLERLAEETGGGGMSAYVRRLIRQEAQRSGLLIPVQPNNEEPQAVTA